MNNFKTDYDGGLPLVLDDFRWIDEGYRKAFYGIMSAFGVTDQETFILSGCTRSVSSGTVSITEGYVSIGGEVCYVPPHSYSEPGGGDVEFWVVDLSFDSAGLKTFQNSSLNNAYEVRSAVVSVGSVVPPGSTSYGDTKTIFQIMAEKIPDITGIKRYCANLTQTGTSAPGIPTFIKENDLPTTRPWTRVGQGRYRLDHTLDAIALFVDPAKLIFFVSGLKNGGTGHIFRDNDYRVVLETFNAIGTLSDDLLDNSTVYMEINP